MPRSVTPVAQPLPPLPPPRLPITQAHRLLIGTARLDSSGRVHEHTLLVALGWHPGVRIDITAVHDAILIRATPTGLHTIGRRGELALPAAARTLSGITTPTVVIAAALDEGTLVVHTPHTWWPACCAPTTPTWTPQHDH